MAVEYECCGSFPQKRCMGYVKGRGCVLMCPKCHTVMATVFSFHPDGREYEKEKNWIKQAKTNKLYFEGGGQ